MNPGYGGALKVLNIAWQKALVGQNKTTDYILMPPEAPRVQGLVSCGLSVS